MRALRGIGRALRETLLTLAAVLGLVCVVLVILAQVAHVSLIMFSTGSMSPTIPAGSVALVREVPAAEFAVGDVVTIDRPGQLPVTHRITGIAPGPSPDARAVTMRGDANDAEDPAPYEVTHGRVVLGSAPGLAKVIVWFSSPWVLGSITLGAALLVMWAFWPRGESNGRSRQDSRRGVVGGQRPPAGLHEPSGQHEAPGAGDRSAVGPGDRSSLARHGALALLGLGCASVALMSSPVPAQAMPAQAVTAPVLELTSNMPSGGQHALVPGVQTQWLVTADASSAPENGQLTVALTAAGDPALGLQVEARSCAVAWAAGSCPAGEQVVLAAGPATLGVQEPLFDLATPAVGRLKLTVWLEPAADATGAESASLMLTATSGEMSDSVTLGGIGGLANTGTSSSVVGIFAAPAAIGVGLGLAALATLHRRRAEAAVADLSPNGSRS